METSLEQLYKFLNKKKGNLELNIENGFISLQNKDNGNMIRIQQNPGNNSEINVYFLSINGSVKSDNPNYNKLIFEEYENLDLHDAMATCKNLICKINY